MRLWDRRTMLKVESACCKIVNEAVTLRLNVWRGLACFIWYLHHPCRFYLSFIKLQSSLTSSCQCLACLLFVAFLEHDWLYSLAFDMLRASVGTDCCFFGSLDCVKPACLLPYKSCVIVLLSYCHVSFLLCLLSSVPSVC